MIVTAKLGSASVKISVGEGKQSIKWLAGAILEAINQQKLLRSAKERDNCIITAIKNSSGELINPKDCIYEHASADQSLTVIVDTASEYESDEWGNPVMSVWASAAYINSPVGLLWRSSMESWRNKAQDIQEHGGLSRTSRVIDPNLVLIGEVYSDEYLKSAFELDWNQMKWDWVTSTNWNESLEAVKKILQLNYGVVCNLFSHYCGHGQVGQRYGLTLREFGHMLHMAKIFDFKDDIKKIEECFNKPIVNRQMSQSSGILMTRVHLSESLVSVATIIKSASPQVLDTLDRLLSNGLRDYWKQLRSDYLIYSLADDSIRIAVREAFNSLKGIFNTKAKSDAKLGPAIFQPDLLDILTAAGIIAFDQEGFSESAFFHAQLNPKRKFELKDMVFIEFLEAVSKAASLAMIVNIGDAERACMALNMITDAYTQASSKK